MKCRCALHHQPVHSICIAWQHSRILTQYYNLLCNFPLLVADLGARRGRGGHLRCLLWALEGMRHGRRGAVGVAAHDNAHKCWILRRRGAEAAMTLATDPLLQVIVLKQNDLDAEKNERCGPEREQPVAVQPDRPAPECPDNQGPAISNSPLRHSNQ